MNLKDLIKYEYVYGWENQYSDIIRYAVLQEKDKKETRYYLRHDTETGYIERGISRDSNDEIEQPLFATHEEAKDEKRKIIERRVSYYQSMSKDDLMGEIVSKYIKSKRWFPEEYVKFIEKMEQECDIFLTED